MAYIVMGVLLVLKPSFVKAHVDTYLILAQVQVNTLAICWSSYCGHTGIS